jgi:hypothetical protein
MCDRLHTELSHVWDVKFDVTNTERPAGVRHEIALDPSDVNYVIVREVWFFSDNGEIHEVVERRIPLNNLVHLAVNMTDTEVMFFSETRTARPTKDWDGLNDVLTPGANT